ncbi:hypothetical protein OVY01_21930 [Robbsia sp. Bb-Pol-6]|uniref:Uncharacterized protein n=1 Tax=Robbsia betulipollinis TaxID=2981849 RepID=A0ABT3ZT97_9BURK|nr:hypothetical protein [Robbsia betulipollinis]MCY0389804.1 hypothetical protein [Robbsia betulipollinis]
MIAVSNFSEIRIFRRVLESLDTLLNSRKETPNAKLMQDAWQKGANDAVVDKKQNPYPKGSDRFNSYEDGHKSQWWLN